MVMIYNKIIKTFDLLSVHYILLILWGISMYNELVKGVTTAFLDVAVNSNLELRPKLIFNDYKEGKKVLTSIEDELRKCSEFMISVAFITSGGITPLLQVFKELEEKKIPGKIITTNYLTFSEPKALKKLSELSNIELRMYDVKENNPGFHTKGYIFKQGQVLNNEIENELYKVIIGSSNMTASALTINKEWNMQIVASHKGEVTHKIIDEFQKLWKEARPIGDLIDIYSEIYDRQREIAKQAAVTSLEEYKLKPNSMQLEFINKLRELRAEGKNKALLISATGTGKTFASAFALRDSDSKKALFVVHREQIAKQALNSYRKVFGRRIDMGLISGTRRNVDAPYIFATMQMMSKPEIYTQFKQDYFDYIIVDEVHRAGAESYQRIMDYFKPKFWLGMTASPERLDGFNIYELFDNNIAYEIRLKQAMEENLLCPFHYFGITDLQINGQVVSSDEDLRKFNEVLTCDERVDYIIQKAKYYGYSGDRVKGLVFCSRKEEASILSDAFNRRGFRTTHLSGDDSQEKRELEIKRLVRDEQEDYLDYIFTVDIFNEGVDIPEINQVIMLRATQSPIIFVQQLGRGLRKSHDKEYVVILDFIGNYSNNFMIPIALSGDRSYNKDNVRRYLIEGTKIIPGSSSISFDEITKVRIYDSIDKMSTPLQLLKQRYQMLKNKLGHIPSIVDFYVHSEIDPMLILEHKGTETYTKFLTCVEDEYKGKQLLSCTEEAMLEMVSSFLANGKRPHELLILNNILDKGYTDKDEIMQQLQEKYEIVNDEDSIDSAINVLKCNFINTKSEKNKYSKINFFEEVYDPGATLGIFRTTKTFNISLDNLFFIKQLHDHVQLGLMRYNDFYSNRIDNTNLVLYQKYSRKDVCRLLNWSKDESSTMYGYRIKYNTCPIFVTYKKQDDISKSTMYEDMFINEQNFNWMTRNRVSINSSETQALINYEKTGLKLHLFVKKSDTEGADFYYIGQVFPIEWKEATISNDKGENLPIMNFRLMIQHTVRDDIYNYFTL